MGSILGGPTNDDTVRSLCLFACLGSSPVLFVNSNTFVYFDLLVLLISPFGWQFSSRIWKFHRLFNRYIPIFRRLFHCSVCTWRLTILFLLATAGYIHPLLKRDSEESSRNCRCCPWASYDLFADRSCRSFILQIHVPMICKKAKLSKTKWFSPAHVPRFLDPFPQCFFFPTSTLW